MMTSYLANACHCVIGACSDVRKSVCRVVLVSKFRYLERRKRTGLSPTCHGIFSTRLDMPRWFETPNLPRDTRHGEFRGSLRN